MAADEEERYRRARKHVEDVRGFYTHLGIYITINLLLVAINLLTSPGALWFYWVTLFWGVGLVFHALDVFVGNRIFGKEWEERKIREVMEREEPKR
ncbi:2TM domain-containing protein [Methanoculleus sp. FWC-SCC1]|uniref:2TM domain-containing protein n=1 Tax=Methanoculleus frigidifontis TaxID=2584085 RepID=A0ABT8MAA8_9EURY|nr:2TM domain-containing protein [Methanoculleus sp. FWC-SCC1]MDN7024870.1 2TM domain-containing protein [Methanoculleus sp. FWC-SCC1]